jgi:hypothetical protein
VAGGFGAFAAFAGSSFGIALQSLRQFALACIRIGQRILLFILSGKPFGSVMSSLLWE